MSHNKETTKFINLESISAKLLFGATFLALLLSNTPLYQFYHNFFHNDMVVQVGSYSFKTNLSFLINDGLMSVFFLVVGLEIKYEMLKGSLNSLQKASLPGIAALGGMIVPGLIYACINYNDSITLRGWAIPTATDIAFALCVLSLLGSNIPSTLKVFLATLAILDDLTAILIIGFFYTDHIAISFLFLSLVCVIILIILNMMNIKNVSVYLLTGIILWFGFLKSGIHPTLAGVVVAFMVPLSSKSKNRTSLLQKLQHTLHPWVALTIIPLFAFSNAGVHFLNVGQENLHIPLILGILTGLFIGKQIGIFGASWLAVKLRVAQLPDGVRWNEVYAVSLICGIGFTMSLFIGGLAFINTSDSYLNSVKIGVLGGSLLSGLAGYLLLLAIYKNRHHKNNKKYDDIKSSIC